ncbi:hypothetical protein ABZ235_35955 [Streptomyces canus]|uniref:hypothetical protein n=1 Tax=Streptomyces canus TaxID=58343 RepID=UPI0033A69E62
MRPRYAGIQAVADEVVEQLVQRRSLHGVADLARPAARRGPRPGGLAAERS